MEYILGKKYVAKPNETCSEIHRPSQKQFEMISLRSSVIFLQVMEGQGSPALEKSTSQEKGFTKKSANYKTNGLIPTLKIKTKQNKKHHKEKPASIIY